METRLGKSAGKKGIDDDEIGIEKGNGETFDFA
jgi:hypothetical protein